MKVKLYNGTNDLQFIDLLGKGNPDDIIVLGSKAISYNDIPNENILTRLAKRLPKGVSARVINNRSK